jgi:hypothetical protein
VHPADASNGAARAVFCEELRGGCGGILGSPREWPEASINEFRQIQQSSGQWFCFFDIANHFAAHTRSLEEERSAKALAYSRLAEFAWTGKFDCGGYIRVLFLKPEPPPALQQAVPGSGYVRPRWLESTDIARGYRVSEDASEFDGNSPLVREILWFCWLPRDLLQQWLSWQRIDPKSFPGFVVMPPEGAERAAESEAVAPPALVAQDDAQPTQRAQTAQIRDVAPNPPEKAHARPPGVSKNAWEIFETALQKNPNLKDGKCNVSEIARALVKARGGKYEGRNSEGVRRAIHRVLKAMNKNN